MVPLRIPSNQVYRSVRIEYATDDLETDSSILKSPIFPALEQACKSVDDLSDRGPDIDTERDTTSLRQGALR
jgi:hypothetical protein